MAINISGQNAQDVSAAQLKAMKHSGQAECQTCKHRKYKDGSDEGNVSFKSAAHISPQQAASKVMAHEQEHVSNAYNKAATKNGKVINASVTLKTAVCPECGRNYVSGGVTHTAIKYQKESHYSLNQKSNDYGSLAGNNVDFEV